MARPKARSFSPVVLTALLGSLALAQQPAPVAEPDPIEVAYDLLAAGTLGDGLAALATAIEAQDDPVERSHLRYVIGRALQNAGDCAGAMAQWTALEADASEGDPWVPRARFGRAECLAADGDEASALALFSSEAETLLDGARRLSIAEELVEIARAARAENEYGVATNANRALGLYNVILALLNEGALHDEADHWVAALNNDTSRLEARLRENPSGEWACHDRLALARFTGDIELLWTTANECTGEVAVDAALLYADYSYGNAVVVLLGNTLITNHTTEGAHLLAQRAALASIAADADPAVALAQVEEAIALAPEPPVDFVLDAASALASGGYGAQARALWERARELTTRRDALERVQTEWADLRRSEAITAANAGDIDGAVATLEALASELPTERSAARELAGQLLARAGRASEAEAAWREAGTPAARQYLIELLESQGRLADAQPLRAELGMRERIEHLEIAVEGSFTSAEPARLHVRSDGIETIEVRYHQVDVEAFLRSMGRLDNLPELDVDLIAPDRTEILHLGAPTYEGYRLPGPTDGSVELGRLEPGVWAIEVVGGSRRAAAIVRVSDVDVVSRAVGGDLAVLVLDARSGEPMAGARVLVANGARVLAEGETGGDGVYRGEVEPGELHVLAISGASATWTTFQAYGESAAEARTADAESRRIWSAVDRSDAEAGDVVRLAAVVNAGAHPWTHPSEELRLRLTSGNQPLIDTTTPLVHGVAEASVELPRDLPDGTYMIVVGDGQHERRHAIRVGPRGARERVVRLEQREERDADGNPVVIVTLHGPSGDPLIAQHVRGVLDDGRGERHLGVTDSAGRLEVSVPQGPLSGAPTVHIEGRSLTLRRGSEVEPAELALPELRPGVAESVRFAWEGAAEAALFVVLERLAGPVPETPTLAPGWWPYASDQLGGTVIHRANQALAAGAAEIALPALAAGSYRLRVEAMRLDGVTTSVQRSFRVVEPGSELELVTPGFDLDVTATREVPYRGSLDITVHSAEPRATLVTLEQVGIVEHRVVRPGEAGAIALPEGLVGTARLAAVGLGDGANTAEVRLDVRRRLDAELAVTEGSEPRATVTVRDEAGAPVSGAAVLVSVRPATSRVADDARALFAYQASILPAAMGLSTGFVLLAQADLIDDEILAWEAEALFAQRDADILLLEQMAGNWERAAAEEPAVAMGAAGYGRGGGGAGNLHAGRAQMNEGIAAGRPRRMAPAAFAWLRTDATGQASVALDPAALERGWYTAEAVVLEGAGVEQSGPPVGDGHGLIVTRSVWLEADTGLVAADLAPRQTGDSDVRIVLGAGNLAELETSGMEWLSIDVAAPGAVRIPAVLLAPDLAPEDRRAYWLEQQYTLRVLEELRAAGEREVPPALYRWIAATRATSVSGTAPVSLGSVPESLSRIEGLAESRVRERAEALLGLGRAERNHPQGQAALLRLLRDPATNDLDTVGTVALAALLLSDEGDELVAERRTYIESAAVSAPTTLGRARALEALAAAGLPMPEDPQALMVAVEESAAERVSIEASAIFGALTRALIYAGTDFEAAPTVTLQWPGRAALTLAPGRHWITLEGAASVALRSEGGTAALRVQRFGAAAPGEGAIRVSQRALRHGVWFQGRELAVPTNAEVGTGSHVLDRPFFVETTVETGSRDAVELELEVFLPPGTQLVPNSLVGMTLVAQEGDRLRVRGSVRDELVIRYVAEPLFVADAAGAEAVDPTWRGPVVRANDGTVAGAGEAATFESSPLRSQEAGRLAGFVLPAPVEALTVPELVDFGVALQGTDASVEGMTEMALEILTPLLLDAELPLSRVQEAGTAAFRAAIALGDDAALRQLFGILESRAPRADVTEDELVAVVRAFVRDGDYDYAMRAWQALLSLRFLAEVGAGERLIDVGLVGDGLAMVHELSRSYPDIPAVVGSMFNLPQLLQQQAESQPDTPEGRFDARRFRRTADRWLGEYVVRYGTSDDADEAAFMQLDVQRELEQWERMVRSATGFAARFPESELLDSYVFMAAYGQQRLGNFEAARTLYTRIAEERFNGAFSSDRDRARLALGQIAHAEGNLTRAIELYREVRDQFPDAQAALAVLESAEIRVPDVVEGAPGSNLRLPLRVRGVESVRIWAYAVDLERLFLREKQIRAVEAISLAGIDPVIELEQALPLNYGTLADQHVDLELPGVGAYLVMVRSDTALASTLAIVTDLQIDIVEDPSARTLHVSVADAAGAPIDDALVRVARRGAATTESERSDLRGLVHLNGYGSDAHVLARVGDSYAVYRGGEVDTFAMPSQIYTGWRIAVGDGLLEGQSGRAQFINEANVMEYEESVLRNRRSVSNFDLE
jgi:tetratricopeptide (TPR) repeat protein